MLLAMLVLLLVACVLSLTAAGGAVRRSRSARRRADERKRRGRERLDVPDPGRERRAERRARELLRSCVNEEEWAMYRDLGFIRVQERAPYAYLIYPHKPLVAYVPETRRVLSEYCIEFPDLAAAVSGGRLPDSDDVLAKWMALTGDERGLIGGANMHLPGRQVDPARVRRDLSRLSEWDRRRAGRTPLDAGPR